MTIELGAINNLRIVKQVDFGLYLDGGEETEILLPNNSIPKEFEIDDFIDVFLYKDSEDRLIATTQMPYAMVGDIAYLEVIAVNSVGAFLNWGLVKDLLVPFREQKRKMEVGNKYLVIIYIDGATDRIVASAKIDGFLNVVKPEYAVGEEVELIIYHKSDLGYNVIINKMHLGLLYDNSIFGEIFPGDVKKGYIKTIRPDEKIDVVLHRPGMEEVDSISENIINKLEQAGGSLNINDNSSPETIYKTFAISKKLFKKTVGTLYKQRIIEITENGIRLVK